MVAEGAVRPVRLGSSAWEVSDSTQVSGKAQAATVLLRRDVRIQFSGRIRATTIPLVFI